MVKDYTEDLLKKMFEMVGAEYDPEIVKEQEWYYLYNWSQKDQDKFIEWATAYLKRKRRWPKFLSDVYIKREVCMFIFNYGWKARREDGVDCSQKHA